MTITQFWLYIVKLGLYKKSEITQNENGFYAILSDLAKPDKKWFTDLFEDEKEFIVHLSYDTIKNNQEIKEKFYL